LFKVDIMKTPPSTPSVWIPITKAILGIVIGLGFFNAQGAPNDAVPGTSGSAKQGDAGKPPVQASGARPHKHKKEMTLAPVKPPSYPSHPLPPPPSHKP
jgi:hypothetical protein